MRRLLVSTAALGALLFSSVAMAAGPETVTLDAASPLLEIRIMVKAGSTSDPAGSEGLAAITADAVLEAGFGDADSPVTKEDLSRITGPWGSGARPQVRVDKQSTTFRMTVPLDVLDQFVRDVLTPMFGQPLFDDEEMARLSKEYATYLEGTLRYQNIELLGLTTLDNYIFEGTSYGHAVSGSISGVGSVDASAARAFFTRFYRPENMILGVSSADAKVIAVLEKALEGSGKARGKSARMQFGEPTKPQTVEGRSLTVVAMPDAIATGIHLGYPIDLDRSHPDFAALYVASVYFGTHRDGHGHLYKQIRQERGYNYGDYAYVEHFAFRPYNLFPPFNTPRTEQYFSMWIRPVGDEFAHHLLKAAVYELENFVRNGVSEEDVTASKNKARVLYLNLAETGARILEAKVDDAYYGMESGYLGDYLARIDAVTADQVNAVIQKYLQAENLKIVMVTNAEGAEAMAENIRNDENSLGKTLEDYQISSHEVDGEEFYDITETRVTTLRRDAVWANHWLNLDSIRVVPVEALFETGAFVAEIEAGAR